LLNLIFRIIILLIVSTNSFAISPRVIYGKDNRVEISYFESQSFRDMSRSVAALIDKELLAPSLDGSGNQCLTMWVESIQHSMLLCDGERFEKQPALSTCTGFLIADDLLLTAGHCYGKDVVSSERRCRDFVWMFDYTDTQSGKFSSRPDEDYSNLCFQKSSVYGCKEIVSIGYTSIATQNSDFKTDYAIIRLDRSVNDRRPLSLRLAGKVQVGTPLVVVGHPWGMPMKAADGASVKFTVGNSFFGANLDTFGSNSGSPVFNAESGLVEGVLVRGKPDIYNDAANRCFKVNVCSDDGLNCNNGNGLDSEVVITTLAILEHAGLEL